MCLILNIHHSIIIQLIRFQLRWAKKIYKLITREWTSPLTEEKSGPYPGEGTPARWRRCCHSLGGGPSAPRPPQTNPWQWHRDPRTPGSHVSPLCPSSRLPPPRLNSKTIEMSKRSKCQKDQNVKTIKMSKRSKQCYCNNPDKYLYITNVIH